MAVDSSTSVSKTSSPQTRRRENRKRKVADDVLGRMEAAAGDSSGRGAASGWTLCPLCQGVSKKRYCLGRGIAAHLHAAHTPWKLSKVELRKKRRRIQRQQAESRRNSKKDTTPTTIVAAEEPLALTTTWEPSEEEQEQWNQRVISIVSDLEQSVAAIKSNKMTSAGLDRNGNESRSYKDSLPPFLQAAANGNLLALQSMVKECQQKNNDSLATLLETRDRNGSTAAHWAAGSGRLTCLKFLLSHQSQKPANTTTRKTRRRRDGKTCLHYAARNGHTHCLEYLINTCRHQVNEASGDGTTPVHMACYGGHQSAVDILLRHGAHVHAANEWGCTCAHWVAMTKSFVRDEIWALCRLLQSKGVSFVTPQKQGHSALHKAAQRQNRHVMEWMGTCTENGGAGLSSEERRQAGQADHGEHLPSDIWLAVGGDIQFARWIQQTFEFQVGE